MNTKRFFAAIFAAAILSISFLACEEKEDDPNPTTQSDVVKEIFGYYGQSSAQVIPILDAKGWIKVSDSADLGIIYTYFSADSLKAYAVYSIDNTIKGAAFSEVENPENSFIKLASNTNKFLLLFEKWEQSLSTCTISNSVYQGSIIADEYEFTQVYDSRAEFLTGYQAKKTTVDMVSSTYASSLMSGMVALYMDYNTDESQVFTVFQDEILSGDKSKNTQNSWFRK